jgi:hypothetical protein
MMNKYSPCFKPFMRRTIWLIIVTLLPGIMFNDFANTQSKEVSDSQIDVRKKLTAAQWREDLQFAAGKFLESDKSFSSEARQHFQRAIDELQKTVDKKTDEQVIVELAKAVALAGNAHTRLYLLRNRSELRRYPIRIWWFSDGLYVVAAPPDHTQLLGAKLTQLGGRSVEKIKKQVAPLYAGNSSWREYMSAYTMTCPEVLMSLGLASADGNISVEFTARSGKKGVTRLEPLPLRQSNQPTESWWDLSPTRPRNDSFITALSLAPARLPLYLRNNGQQYWSQFLPNDKILYIQFNRAGDAPAGETFAEFGKRTLAELLTVSAKKIVVDLRFNTGGNLDVASPFMRQLAEYAKQRETKVYVITGRATFSAGLFHAMQLRQLANAVLVGEPVGDDLDYWAEGGNVVLPNSKLTLHYADRFHSYSSIERPEFKEYLFTVSDLSVTHSAPDILLKMSAKEYLAGRDPSLEAIKSDRGVAETRVKTQHNSL